MTGIVEKPLASSDILAIAQADAETRYTDFHIYRIEIYRESDGWHVEYRIQQPKDPKIRIAGGGPHYVIDASDGRIISKKYYQ